MQHVKLGLIGDHIDRSRSPELHRLGGRIVGLDVTYDRLIPRDMGLDFDAVFDRCAASGYRGINVTYPYKERAAARVTVEDPAVRAIGAVNTVVFEPGGPKGFNTDFTGFQAGFRQAFGEAATPGAVTMVGAGGVGKAIAYGLFRLGVTRLTLVERDLQKARTLGEGLRRLRPEVQVEIASGIHVACDGADGIVNCTPVGMSGHEGTPVPREALEGARWAFDAVYTPVHTRFLRDARAMGLQVMSGYELFFYQGLHAFEIFCGPALPEDELRAALTGVAA